MSSQPKPCHANCEFFRCSQRSLRFKGNVPWCGFADDECEIASCKYAQCVRSRLLPKGVCGFTVPIKSIEAEPKELAKPIKVPPKLMQKIKERELF